MRCFHRWCLAALRPRIWSQVEWRALTDAAVVRTTLMKVATLSTIWDYINRAMPWNAPKSLEVDEVYALTAYLLHLGYIVEYDFVLSNENINDVQAQMPNRNGMTTGPRTFGRSAARQT